MKRVTNWQEYKENWMDWSDCIIESGLDVIITAALACLFMVVFVPITFLCLLGYAPEYVEEDDGEQ